MKAIVVYNPKSGSAVSASELSQRFKRAGIHIEKLIDITKGLKQLEPWQDQTDTVIAAVGGDGTISGVAGALMNHRAIFAPLPGGTLNHFTKDLGIPQDLDEALAGLPDASSRRVDIATVNNVTFINNSSIGIYPSTLQMREQLEDSVISKWPAAVIAAIKALIRYRTYTVTIGNETFKTPFLFVGNNDYHFEDPGANGRNRLDEGVLSVYTVTSASRLSLIKLIGKVLIGRPGVTDELKIWKTKELKIHARKHSIRVARDGELMRLQTPLHYVSAPKSLIVIGSW